MSSETPGPDPMRHLELMITRGCSLRCPYCQVARRNESMPPQIVRRAIDLALTSQSPEVDLLFFGGEPLERTDLVREAVEHAEARGAGRVRYILVTNGLHLDEQVLAMFPPGRVQVYLNLVGFSTGRDEPAQLRPRGRVSAKTLQNVAMLERAGVWQCVNLVADPADLGIMRAAVDALRAAQVPRFQVFFHLGVEWPEEAAAALLEELRALLPGTGRPQLMNAVEAMPPFLLHNDAVVDTDGDIYWSAGLWLEQEFPELTRACRIGRVGDVAQLQDLWEYPRDIFRRLASTYPPGSPRERVLRNNVELGLRMCRLFGHTVWTGEDERAG